jgi:hypothetical protein
MGTRFCGLQTHPETPSGPHFEKQIRRNGSDKALWQMTARGLRMAWFEDPDGPKITQT